MAGWATRLNGETIPVSSPGNWLAYTLREPVGVVGQIIPWNFPLMMAAWKLAPALAAGCTIVLKPAEQTPLSALRLGELIAEAGILMASSTSSPGSGRLRARLWRASGRRQGRLHRLDRSRKAHRKAAAGNLKRVSLELVASRRPSSSPTPISNAPSAGTADAIFYNQGQCCTAGSRLFAHKSIYDKVVEGVVARAGKIKVGHGLDPTVDLGPLVSKEHIRA